MRPIWPNWEVAHDSRRCERKVPPLIGVLALSVCWLAAAIVLWSRCARDSLSLAHTHLKCLLRRRHCRLARVMFLEMAMSTIDRLAGWLAGCGQHNEMPQAVTVRRQRPRRHLEALCRGDLDKSRDEC